MGLDNVSSQTRFQDVFGHCELNEARKIGRVIYEADSESGGALPPAASYQFTEST